MKSLHNFVIIMKSDNVQQQFAYFIVAICRNAFLSHFL